MFTSINFTKMEDLDYVQALQSEIELERVNLSIKNYSEVGFLQAAAASRFDLTPLIETLIKAGIDVNEKVKDGTTALSFASTTGHLENMKCLMRLGAKVFSSNPLNLNHSMFGLILGYSARNSLNWADRFEVLFQDSQCPVLFDNLRKTYDILINEDTAFNRRVSLLTLEIPKEIEAFKAEFEKRDILAEQEKMQKSFPLKPSPFLKKHL